MTDDLLFSVKQILQVQTIWINWDGRAEPAPQLRFAYSAPESFTLPAAAWGMSESQTRSHIIKTPELNKMSQTLWLAALHI